MPVTNRIPKTPPTAKRAPGEVPNPASPLPWQQIPIALSRTVLRGSFTKHYYSSELNGIAVF